MSVDNKNVVRKLFNDFLSKGNLTVADQIIAPNHIHHDPATPDFGLGPEGQKKTISLYRNAFPDLRFKVNEMIVAGNFVTTRYTSTGTHKVEFNGIAPTNRTLSVEGIAINRLSRGKIVETWVVWDALGLMQQLGQVPALERAKAQVAK
jgi:predicted ester cyclase